MAGKSENRRKPPQYSSVLGVSGRLRAFLPRPRFPQTHAKASLSLSPFGSQRTLRKVILITIFLVADIEGHKETNYHCQKKTYLGVLYCCILEDCKEPLAKQY
ncbi:Hypothetical predicted protein [Podarcis lilfordi]|uniref:Uncharacterized protein n=1 Tax=Podarcis lilfordi TaxID=74358 RepID=A0AA35KLL6_9SAUR|nr:Hypothetical predicted protein [Podarcis lilfordi]